jgi:hypothetical protein
VGFLEEAPPAVTTGPGERSPDVPEELTLEQSFRQGRAVHPQEPGVSTLTRVVDRVGKEFLSRTTLSVEQHRCGSTRGGARLAHRLEKGGLVTDYVVKGIPGLKLADRRPGVLELVVESAEFAHILDDRNGTAHLSVHDDRIGVHDHVPSVRADPQALVPHRLARSQDRHVDTLSAGDVDGTRLPDHLLLTQPGYPGVGRVDHHTVPRFVHHRDGVLGALEDRVIEQPDLPQVGRLLGETLELTDVTKDGGGGKDGPVGVAQGIPIGQDRYLAPGHPLVHLVPAAFEDHRKTRHRKNIGDRSPHRLGGVNPENARRRGVENGHDEVAVDDDDPVGGTVDQEGCFAMVHAPAPAQFIDGLKPVSATIR